MLFSVVIPSYNRRDLLPRTLTSVWEQTFGDYELIVVDDGSTDGTRELLRSYGRRLQLIEQENRGPGAARNRALEVARGEYLAFLDSDDVWFAWTLQTFAELIQRHGRPALLSAELIEFAAEEELEVVRLQDVQSEVFTDYFSSFAAGHYVGAGMSVIRRDVLSAVGGFPEDRANAEDHDLIFRLGTAAGFVKVIRPVTLGWRRHSASETGNVTSTAAGVLRMVHNEKSGSYPGADARRRERQAILTSHARPASLGCLHQGAMREAWRVYWATLSWHLRQGRWRFLLGFPAMSVRTALRTRRPSVP